MWSATRCVIQIHPFYLFTYKILVVMYSKFLSVANTNQQEGHIPITTYLMVHSHVIIKLCWYCRMSISNSNEAYAIYSIILRKNIEPYFFSLLSIESHSNYY